MVLDSIVRNHSDVQHVFGTSPLMKTAQNTEHTSTTSEFVNAGKRFRKEFEFSSGLVPDADLASSLHTFESTGPREQIANHHASSIHRLPVKARA